MVVAVSLWRKGEGVAKQFWSWGQGCGQWWCPGVGEWGECGVGTGKLSFCYEVIGCLPMDGELDEVSRDSVLVLVERQTRGGEIVWRNKKVFKGQVSLYSIV